MPTLRTLLAVLLACLIAALAGMQIAHAQPAPLKTTPGTECGEPGVGKGASRRSEPTARHEPGIRVDADGIWRDCRMPRAAPDCPEKAISNWGPQFAECKRSISTIRAAKHGVTRTVLGLGDRGNSDVRGKQVWTCTPAGWKLTTDECRGAR